MARLSVGVIGCGAIAQIQHLPHLRELDDRFAIGGICDLSEELLRKVGDDFGVPNDRRFKDYRDLVASDIEAVVVCPSGTHAPHVIAAAEAGKHVLVEKPACYTVREAEAMLAATERAGIVYMVAYPKRYEPAYRYAQARVARMADIRFVQVNHLHPDNALHLAEFRLHLPGDIAEADRAAQAAESGALISEALELDAVSPETAQSFNLVNGSLIHDISVLHGLFGRPLRVVSTEIWRDGRAVSTVLEYAADVRAVATWVDLPELSDFKETLEVYGSRERVIVRFPTGFSRGLPTRVTVQEIEDASLPTTKRLEWHENPFKVELAHFGDCIREGRVPLTSGDEVVQHVALVRDIVRAHLSRGAGHGA